MNTYLKCIITIVVLTISITAKAQTVYGEVKDVSDSVAVNGAIVMLKRNDGALISYTTTGNNGKFMIENKGVVDSCYLEISLLGYATQKIYSPFLCPVMVLMQMIPYEINPVTVKASKVETRGDTVSYSVPAMVSADDRTLGDFLKKIPGIDVTKAGLIRYEGKSINKFYIEGHDLLEGKYYLATQNINPNDLSKVEIYENHQHIKALEGISTSEQAAINITLKKAVISRWIANLQAEAGISSVKPWIPYSANGFLMNISRLFQTMNTLKTDAAGNIISSLDYGENVIVLGEERINKYKLNDYFRIDMENAPINDNRTRFNTSYSISSNTKFVLGQDYEMGVGILYSKNNLSANKSITRIYDMQDGTYTAFTEVDDRSLDNYNASGDINIYMNTSKRYLKNKLVFEINRSNGKINIDGTEKRLQQVNNKDININNALNYIKRFKNNTTIGFKMDTQYSQKDGYLSIAPSSDSDKILQDVSSNVFFNRITFTASKNIGTNCILWSVSETEYINRRFFTDLVGLSISDNDIPLSTDNDINLQYIRQKEILNLNYKSRRLEAAIGSEIWYQFFNYSIISNRTNLHKLAVNPTLSLKYIFNAKLNARIYGLYALSPVDEQSIFDGLVMNNYKYLTQGRTNLIQTPRYSAHGELSYKEPLSGWYLKTTASYSYNNSFQSTRFFIDDYIINKESNDIVKYDNWSATASISKGFFNIGGKLTAVFGFNKMNSTINQNNIESLYDGYNYSASLEFIGEIFQWWKISYNGKYSFMKYKIDKVWNNDANHSAVQKLSFSFFPCKSVEVDIIGEHYFDKSYNGNPRQMMLLDFSVWYFISKKLQLFLHAKNLLDEREYAFTYLSPLLTTHYQYAIRPLNILIGADFKF